MRQRIPLEAAAQAVCDQSAVPPLIFQLPPEEGRRRLEEAQNAPVYLYPADTAVRLTDTGGWGRVPVSDAFLSAVCMWILSLSGRYAVVLAAVCAESGRPPADHSFSPAGR